MAQLKQVVLTALYLTPGVLIALFGAWRMVDHHLGFERRRRTAIGVIAVAVPVGYALMFFGAGGTLFMLHPVFEANRTLGAFARGPGGYLFYVLAYLPGVLATLALVGIACRLLGGERA